LIAAGAVLISLTAAQSPLLDVMIVAAMVAFIGSKVKPLWLLGAGALLGAAGLV
jgi:multisubunit Na+/H+ antiporter MnhF subunit